MKLWNVNSNGYQATTFISTINEFSVFSFKKLYNHPVWLLEYEVRELGNILGQKYVQHTVCSFSAHILYTESIAICLYYYYY